MPTIVFVESNGTAHRVDGAAGQSLMQAATENMVPGILADCGGACACATCHVYIEPPQAAQLPPPSLDELSLLEGALDTRPSSRLSCQVKLAPQLDGLVVQIPVSQY